MLHHLSARCVRCGIVAVTVVFCGSAFAGSNKEASAIYTKAGHRTARKICYLNLSNTSFAQPCNYVVNGIASTTTPMNILGEMPIVRAVQK